MRVAIYLRKSTEKQAASIGNQRTECQSYAKRQGWDVVAEYADERISGVDSLERRSGFQQAIAASMAGRFDVLLALDMSRFTRSDPMRMMAELVTVRDAGVSLATVDKGLRGWDFSTFLTDGIDGNSNNEESRKKGFRVSIAQRGIARRGGWIGGRTPFGYSYVKEHCEGVPNDTIRRLVLGKPKEVAAAKWVFHAYATSTSLAGVGDGLGDLGFTITKEAVRKILTHPVYVGDYVWNRTGEGKFYKVSEGEVVRLEQNEAKSQKKSTRKEDWVYIRDNHEAIVDRQTFNKIQATFERRKKTGSKSGRKFAPTGLCRCSQCGGTMVAYVQRAQKGDPVVWRCGRYASSGKCLPNPVYERDLIDAISTSIRNRFTNPEMRSKLRLEVEKQLKSRAEGVDPVALKRQRLSAMRKLSKHEDRLLEVSVDMVPRVEAQIREVEDRIAAYDRDIESATTDVDETLRALESDVDDVLSKLDMLDDIIAQADPGEVREYLSDIIDEIQVEVGRAQKGPSGKRFRYHLVGGTIKFTDSAIAV